MHAGDYISTIYLAAYIAEELNNVLNDKLYSVVKWVKNNKLVLNVSKTNSTIIGLVL